MGEDSRKERALGASLADLLVRKDLPPLSEANRYESRIGELEKEKEALELENLSLREALKDLRSRLEEGEGGSGAEADVLFRKAVETLKDGNFIDALGLLQAVLLRDPAHLKARINLAVAYAELGFSPKAMEMFRSVLELDPDNPTAKKNLRLLMKRL